MTSNVDAAEHGQGTDRESRTVDVDRHAIDSSDLANLGLHDVGEVAVDLVGKPDSAGCLPEGVRVTGQLTVERVGDDE